MRDDNFRARVRDEKLEQLAGFRGDDNDRALTLADMDGILGAAIQKLLKMDVSQVAQIVFSATSTPPMGYLACDGDIVSRTQFARLFAAIGTTYGVGDGYTTFELPTIPDYSAMIACIRY